MKVLMLLLFTVVIGSFSFYFGFKIGCISAEENDDNDDKLEKNYKEKKQNDKL